VIEPLTLPTVQDHPDDKTAETGGVTARCAAEGELVIPEDDLFAGLPARSATASTGSPS